MIFKWLRERKQRRYDKEYQKGYTWALMLLRDFKEPVDSVERVVNATEGSDAHRDGALTCCLDFKEGRIS